MLELFSTGVPGSSSVYVYLFIYTYMYVYVYAKWPLSAQNKNLVEAI